MAKKSMIIKAAERLQILYAQLYEMPYLRETSRCSEKIRHLPCLLSRACIPWSDPRCEKSKLVIF